MKPVYISIDQEKTGRRIKALMKEKNLSVRDMQEACGFERPQAVYKWLGGKTLPSIESLVIIAALFHVSIDGILVKCGDAAFLFKKFFREIIEHGSLFYGRPAF